MFRPTNKTVWPTQKSHVNYLIAEDNSWQQIAAQTLDAMDCVETWVRNQFLGQRIPYTIGDENKEYQPTFIVRTKGINLIVECEDFDGDHSGNKEAKRHCLKDYWIPAANNLKTYGEWDLLEVSDVDKLEEEILKAIFP